jgi:hypothetical protein
MIIFFVITGVLLASILLLHCFCYFFLGKALLPQLQQYLRSNDDVAYRRDKYCVFEPQQGSIRAGLVFHPGGYVDPESYARIFSAIARQGILCIIVPGPFRTPIARRFSSDQVMLDFPEVKPWFIAGHSQGGAVASLYVRDRHAEKDIIGLIFLGFFVFDRHSLSHLDMPTLTVFGDHDGHSEKFEPNHKNLPAGADIVKVIGGNHGQFGHYGLHFGDRPAEIPREQQQQAAIDAISQFINRVLEK